MEAAAVSVATSYKGLCLATKFEERRPEELRKQRQYDRPTAPLYPSRRQEDSHCKISTARSGMTHPTARKKCYNCDQLDYLSWDCPQRRNGSSGRSAPKARRQYTKQVHSARDGTTKVEG